MVSVGLIGAYFSGCSTGGQQALTEAQRFPGDYDGILAGSPGINRVRLNVGFLWSWRAANPDAAAPLPVAKLAVVHKAGYTHRDIKPGNIYMREDGSPVLLDFGACGRA